MYEIKGKDETEISSNVGTSHATHLIDFHIEHNLQRILKKKFKLIIFWLVLEVTDVSLINQVPYKANFIIYVFGTSSTWNHRYI